MLKLNGVPIRILQYTEADSSSLALLYRGEILANEKHVPELPVTVKEFYPSCDTELFDAERQKDGTLAVRPLTRESQAWMEQKERFQAEYRIWQMLAAKDLTEAAVSLKLYGSYGDTLYLVSDAHNGVHLDQAVFATLEERLDCAIHVAALFGMLHEKGLMMPDFDPGKLLWTAQPRAARFLDVSGVIRCGVPRTAAAPIAETGTAEEILAAVARGGKYLSPEIRRLGDILRIGSATLDEKRSTYLRPAANIYSLGLYFFELFFGRLPDRTERQGLPDTLAGELCGRYRGELTDEKAAAELLGVLKKALQSSQIRREKAYKTACELEQALQRAAERLRSAKYLPKKAVKEADYVYLAYHFLQQNPLYEYEKQELETGKNAGQKRKTLDVAIVGSHKLREYLLRAIISCCQMFDASQSNGSMNQYYRLRIRLISRDARKFWEDYISDRKNPEIRRTVFWSLNGKNKTDMKALTEARIVSYSLANVELYTDDSDAHILEIVRENRVPCIIFACEEQNYERACALIKKLPRRKHLVAHLTGTQGLTAEGRGRIKVFPINTAKNSETYSEERVKSEIYNMGLSVHEFYYRGNHPRASLEELQADYAKDEYNIESSVRCALHANYKLKSIGIDPAAPDAPWRFYDAVLSGKRAGQKARFDQLVALEHRSWTAFLVFSGVRAADDVRASLERYAYQGNSDHRERDSRGRVICHPCLKMSRPGRGLTLAVWHARGQSDEEISRFSPGNNINRLISRRNRLDPLDQASLEIYMGIERAAELRKGKIRELLNHMRECLKEAEDTEAADACRELQEAFEKVYNRETRSEDLWKQALADWQSACAHGALQQGSLQEMSDELCHLMRPALWVICFHDFKKSDEDILRALPKILLQSQKRLRAGAPVTIVKPMSSRLWENLFSAIMLTPDRLVLVPLRGELEKKTASETEEEYRTLLQSCQVTETEVLVRTPKQLARYGGEKGHIFIDETGVTPEHSRMITARSSMRQAHTFMVENRMLKPTDENSLITVFQRSLNLTVNETMILHGASVRSEKTADYVVGLKEAEYKALWGLYQSLSRDRQWKIFINELRRAEEGKVRCLDLKRQTVRPSGMYPATDPTSPEELREYIGDYAEGEILHEANLDAVFRALKSKNLIADYELPQRGEYGQVRVTTGYPDVADALEAILKQAIAEPLRHFWQAEFTVAKLTFGERLCDRITDARLRDDSLYVSVRVPRARDNTLDPPSGSYRSDVIKKAFDSLRSSGNTDRVFPGFQCAEMADGSRAVSFRYASLSVREILRKEGSILEAVIFHECRKWRVFDDIRCNVEFDWPGKRTCNEIDVIGTKNSKTYFISAKMSRPEKEHVYEVKSLCEQFAIEGKAILISSYYLTDEELLQQQIDQAADDAGKERYRGVQQHMKAVRDRISDMEDTAFIGIRGVEKRGSRRVAGSYGGERQAPACQFIVADSIQKCLTD